VRLVCQSCGTRFFIADRLVRGKLVRFRCKQCSTILEAYLSAHEKPPEHLLPTMETPRPPPLPEKQWFLGAEGRQLGPLSTAELRHRVRRGEVGPDDLIWRKGLGMWQPIVAVEEVAGAFNEPPEKSSARPPPLPDLRPVLNTPLPAPYPMSASFIGAQPLPPQPQAYAEPVLGVPLPPQGQGSNLWPIYTLPIKKPARWPFWFAITGGVVMIITAATLLFMHDRPRHQSASVEILPVVGRRSHVAPPVADLEEAPAPSRGVHPAAPHVLEDLPPIEVQKPRPSGGPSRFGEDVPDRIVATDPLSAKFGAQPDDLKTVLALQIYRRNKSSLVACDQLAERRGETFDDGSRAEFKVHITAAGKATIQVRGFDLSETTLACYRAMASQWQFTISGVEYSTSFEHVH
jgi:predicted Zn finger-like uncharacterized protein